MTGLRGEEIPNYDIRSDILESPGYFVADIVRRHEMRRARGTSMGSIWTFEAFDQADAERSRQLQSTPPWPELVSGVRDALRAAIESGHVRFGLDESSRDINNLRGVVQFPIGRALFDRLFNSTTGYRAQFRIDACNGLLQNAYIISELRAELGASESQQIVAHRLTPDFQYKEPVHCDIDQIMASLDPCLSKVWACEKLIGEDGKIHELFVSRTGPKLIFADSDPWSSLYPEGAEGSEGAEGWLDVKGAFLAPAGAYQPKSPKERAANLQQRGSA